MKDLMSEIICFHLSSTKKAGRTHFLWQPPCQGALPWCVCLRDTASTLSGGRPLPAHQGSMS